MRLYLATRKVYPPRPIAWKKGDPMTITACLPLPSGCLASQDAQEAKMAGKTWKDARSKQGEH
jgi:hypothetical protein